MTFVNDGVNVDAAGGKAWRFQRLDWRE